MFGIVAYVLYAVDCSHIPRTTHYFIKERTNIMKKILLTTTNTRTELILLLLIIHFYSYPVLKQKRISIPHLTLKGLLITLQLIIHLCMLHLLLIASCKLGLLLWMRIGVRNVLQSFGIFINSHHHIIMLNMICIFEYLFKYFLISF